MTYVALSRTSSSCKSPHNHDDYHHHVHYQYHHAHYNYDQRRHYHADTPSASASRLTWTAARLLVQVLLLYHTASSVFTSAYLMCHRNEVL